MQAQFVAVKIEAQKFDEAMAEADVLLLENSDREDEMLVRLGGKTVALAVFGCVNDSGQPIVLVGFDGGEHSRHWFRYFIRFGEEVRPPEPKETT